LLSITTDPARDSSAALKSYAEQFKADFNHWLFLTGSEKDLNKVWKGFDVTVRKTADGQIQHTALTTLIDRRGVRRESTTTPTNGRKKRFSGHRVT
jgi:protein SCO1/2